MKQILAWDQKIDVPPEVAVCPYCGDKLWVECEGLGLCADGTWQADGIRLECYSEPALEEGCDKATEAAWQDWLDAHTYMPYVYWLPVDKKVLSWMATKFRFAVMEGTP